MPVNNRGVYLPDFDPNMQMPQWTDMGQSDQVDISPAVGAFQSRFMNGAQPAHGAAPHMPTGSPMAPHEGMESMDMLHGMPNKAGGGMKSL